MFLDDMAASGKKIVGGVFVEALPRSSTQEVEWVRKSAANGLPNVIVARADLCADNVGDVLNQLTAPSDGAPVRGIRQILNWEPTWPFVTGEHVVSSPEFERG